jgi:hypothetical protein
MLELGRSGIEHLAALQRTTLRDAGIKLLRK